MFIHLFFFFCLHQKIKEKLAIYLIYVIEKYTFFFCGLTKSGNLRAFLSMTQNRIDTK